MISEEVFRNRVKDFFLEYAPEYNWLRDEFGQPQREEQSNEQRLKKARNCLELLHKAGLAALTWPIKFGGQGLTKREQIIFNQEAARYDLPLDIFIIGFGMCAPTIMSHGTDLQKNRYLPRLLNGEDIWCQLFSEPEAGSDLSSIRCSAEFNNGFWKINGQKVWISGAHNAAFGTLLVRTQFGVSRHLGFTMFIVDMTNPGITIRPLRQMNGTSKFNEVFFDNCVVAPEDVLGDVGVGWQVATTSLMNERLSIGTGSPTGYGHPTSALIKELQRNGGMDMINRQKTTELYIREKIIAFLSAKATNDLLEEKQPGPEGSLIKLATTQISKDSAGVAMSIVGASSIAWCPDDLDSGVWSDIQTTTPGLSIAGGTDEIQRSIIGEKILGLPREPR